MMRFKRPIALGTACAMALGGVAPGAMAQDQVLELMSGGGYVSLRLPNDVSQVDLQEQTQGRCRFNRSWGYDLSNHELWADAGCGGRFRLTRPERVEHRGSNTAIAVAAVAAIAGVALLANHNRNNQRPANPAPAPEAPRGGTVRGMGGLCLDSEGNDLRNGARLQVYGCHGRGNQRFQWGRGGELMVGSLCLDIEGASRADGARVIAWSCSGAQNQRWRSNGNQIVSQLNGKCLDLYAGQARPGQPVVVWACNGGANQRWWW